MDSNAIAQQIRTLDTIQEIKHCKVSESSLGGHTSNFVHLSLDPKDSWINGIYHNSRYAIFSIQGGKLELISKGLNMPKFRKCNAKSNEDVAAKIVKYCVGV